MSQPDETVSRRLADLPKRRPNDKTSGLRLTGNPDGRSLLSGHDEQYEAAKELIREKELGPSPHNLAIASHVEVKFAMLMRERGLTDEAVVINNVPCKAPFGCERYLADILSPGARLTIYAPGYKRTFTGKESQE